MKREILDTQEKASQINRDPLKYGSFAEIGAGQEVARWFFRAGGASHTIAKSTSAYDMMVSDSLYGVTERYVSRNRLERMLEYEYNALLQLLDQKRGATTKFFVFCDTVAARSKVVEDSHGWMGIRFQTHPKGPFSEIIVHVRMLDSTNLQQQEAIGIVGVNLIHGAMYLHDDPTELIGSLQENLSLDRIELDLIKFSGPAFEGVDNRLMSLELVRQGIANAAMFTADGEVVQAAEVLWRKPILVERGSFRPITNATMDMLECAQAQFIQEPNVFGEPIVVLMEMTMKNLTTEGGINPKDFLERVDMLCALGKTVLISNYGEYYRLAAYLFRYTKKMIGIVMGVPTLRELFDEKYYTELEGGILESFGRLFKNALKLYVYPLQDPRTGSIITAGNLRVAPNLRHLYAYLIENHFIQGIREYNEACLPIFSRDVLEKIQRGDPSWEKLVPLEVGRMIKERNLLGHHSNGAPQINAVAQP
ncbi:MAG TPA: TonB-dependent receptor [Methylomirabilota bacterium]|nr:TonB-dependent receptor [Methylomirabilota bacterium]